jgi:hypothetical protein
MVFKLFLFIFISQARHMYRFFFIPEGEQTTRRFGIKTRYGSIL